MTKLVQIRFVRKGVWQYPKSEPVFKVAVGDVMDFPLELADFAITGGAAEYYVGGQDSQADVEPKEKLKRRGRPPGPAKKK